jgi:hypothetical protein
MYKAEPSNPYSFMGYDITYYFISALNLFGKDITNCIEKYKVNLLQQEMSFVKESPQKGFENKSVYIIKYEPDFTVVKIN